MPGVGMLQKLTESALTRAGLHTAQEYAGLLGSLDLARESLADAVARLRREDHGWTPLSNAAGIAEEFTYEQRRYNAVTARTFAVANPLAKNGLNIRAGFIWGNGVGVTATDDAVNEIIQGFLDDRGNRASFTGHKAHLRLEKALATDGNVFLACFTDSRTGYVQVRSVPFTEVTEIITNPDDKSEPRYYRRQWVQTGEGGGARQLEMIYPALGYYPPIRPRRIDGVEVRWDAPIIHVYDNENDGWQYGVGDLYPAIAWLRAYTGFLTDWSKLTKSISTIAYKISGKTRTDTMAARQAMQAAMQAGTPGGALAVTNAEVEKMPNSGATIDANSGDPLARMIAAGLGIPITLLFGDPGTTGARAVAETLTQPMVLGFKARRELWTETYRAILNHVIDAHIAAPGGALTGTLTRRGETLDYDTAHERTLVIEWPEIEDISLTDVLDAVEKLDATGLAPKKTLARLALRALRVRDVDEELESMTDSEGNFIPAGEDLATALMDKYRSQGG